MFQLPSFKKAREAFSKNLKRLIDEYDYTPATLSLKLNSLCDKDIVTSKDIYNWIENKSVPNIYQLYKLTSYLKSFTFESMDSLFSFNTVDENMGIRSQTHINNNEYELIDNLIFEEKNSMTTSNTKSIFVSKESKKRMLQVVASRTSSKNFNLLLANRIYNSETSLKSIATFVGCSTRSLRDYAYYGMSVNKEVADNLVSYFHTNHRSLGLVLDKTTGRYNHLTVKTAKK